MVPPLTLCAYMKKGPNLRWSLIQCSGGDEGDRTPDLLTASQALSQLSYAPVRRSTIRELGRRCKDNFGKYSAARGTGTRPKRHTMPEIARGARPAGGGKPAAFLPGVRHVAPDAVGQTKAIRVASGGLSPSAHLRANLRNRAKLAPAGRFINRPVYYADSWIFDLTPILAKRAGNLPAVLRAANSVCSATLNPT